MLTSYPIKQVLLKPKTFGRLTKWAMDLGDHDINYHDRVTIKGQELADFLLEIPRDFQQEVIGTTRQGCPEEKTDQQWTLYNDGASSKEGSGAGLILTSPMGEEIKTLYVSTSIPPTTKPNTKSCGQVSDWQ